MRQTFIVLILGILVVMAVACGQQESHSANVATTATIYSSIEEAQAAVGESGRPIVVDFYAVW